MSWPRYLLAEGLVTSFALRSGTQKCGPLIDRATSSRGALVCLPHSLRQFCHSKKIVGSQASTGSALSPPLQLSKQDAESATPVGPREQYDSQAGQDHPSLSAPSRKFVRRPWSQSELDTLHELRGKGLSWNAIANALGRSEPSVRQRFLRGLMATSKSRPWTEDEDRQLLRDRADGKSYSSIMTNFQGRSPSAVFNRMYYLLANSANATESSREPWTKDSITTLRYLRDTLQLSWTDVARRMPGRSMRSVMKKYHGEQSHTTQLPRRWSENEDQMVSDLRKRGRSYDEIAKELVGRTARSVKHRCNFYLSHRLQQPDGEDEKKDQK